MVPTTGEACKVAHRGMRTVTHSHFSNLRRLLWVHTHGSILDTRAIGILLHPSNYCHLLKLHCQRMLLFPTIACASYVYQLLKPCHHAASQTTTATNPTHTMPLNPSKQLMVDS